MNIKERVCDSCLCTLSDDDDGSAEYCLCLYVPHVAYKHVEVDGFRPTYGLFSPPRPTHGYVTRSFCKNCIPRILEEHPLFDPESIQQCMEAG